MSFAILDHFVCPSEWMCLRIGAIVQITHTHTTSTHDSECFFLTWSQKKKTHFNQISRHNVRLRNVLKTISELIDALRWTLPLVNRINGQRWQSIWHVSLSCAFAQLGMNEICEPSSRCEWVRRRWCRHRLLCASSCLCGTVPIKINLRFMNYYSFWNGYGEWRV